jgi:hypothetical protein
MDKDHVRQFVRETFRLKAPPPTPDRSKSDRMVESLLRRIDAVRRVTRGGR